MQSICLITCYMGPLPNYFGYFVASCKQNTSIDFIVINDHIQKNFSDENVHYLKMDLIELNNYVSEKLGVNISLSSAWKINELKPLFGAVFKDRLKNYDRWGWCDLDIIWGNLRHFLNDDVLKTYDIITTKELWSTGHFTLFKNNELCNHLYNRFSGIIGLLNDPTYFAFEECCHRWNGELLSFEELDRKGLPVSMFDIIKNSESKGELRAHFKDIIREHPQPINYTYKNGRLTDLKNNEEFMYYHLITVKKIWRFYIPEYKKGCDSLVISHYGIRCENDIKFTWFFKRVYSCFLGIKKSAETQDFGALIKKLFKFKRTWV